MIKQMPATKDPQSQSLNHLSCEFTVKLSWRHFRARRLDALETFRPLSRLRNTLTTTSCVGTVRLLSYQVISERPKFRRYQSKILSRENSALSHAEMENSRKWLWRIARRFQTENNNKRLIDYSIRHVCLLRSKIIISWKYLDQGSGIDVLLRWSRNYCLTGSGSRSVFVLRTSARLISESPLCNRGSKGWINSTGSGRKKLLSREETKERKLVRLLLR